MMRRIYDIIMARGRPPQTTELQVLLEILLVRERAVFGSEIAENVDVGKERVRQLCVDLADKGFVEIDEVSGRKLYRLTDEGYAHLAEKLRIAIN